MGVPAAEAVAAAQLRGRAGGQGPSCRAPPQLLPSVLILRAVRTRANRVALNMTVPSLFRGMFMETRRWRGREAKLVTTARGSGRTRRATTAGGAETELSTRMGGGVTARAPGRWRTPVLRGSWLCRELPRRLHRLGGPIRPCHTLAPHPVWAGSSTGDKGQLWWGASAGSPPGGQHSPQSW